MEKPLRFRTFEQLASKEYAAERRRFGLKTSEEVRQVAADFLDYKDPDYLRLPDGKPAIAFMEVGGIVASIDPVSAPQLLALIQFFANKEKNSLSEIAVGYGPEEGGWSALFGGRPNEVPLIWPTYNLPAPPAPLVAYRGGSGYTYTFYEILSDDQQQMKCASTKF